MLVYKTVGALGGGRKSSSKDFHCRYQEGPTVTIAEDPNFVGVPEPMKDETGWFDVTVRTLNEYTVKAALAEINGVDIDQITVVESI